MGMFGVDATADRAVAAAAAALLVVGAGAAVGMGTTGGSRHAGSPGFRANPAVAGGPTSTSAVSTTIPSPTTTTPGSGSQTVPVMSQTTAPVVSDGRAGGASSEGPSAPDTAPSGHGPVATSSAPGMTPSGTYTYDTSGSATLFSNTTPYPAKTTIVVGRQGCGVSAKWNSSPGNSTTVYECPVAGGVHVVSETTTVDAGGYRNTMTFDCDSDSFVPTSGTPGQTWTWSCHSSGADGGSGETSTQTVKLIGPETMTVAGASVSTEHVHIVSTLSGPQKGTVTTDYWLTPNATVVHEVGSVEASQLGVTYRSDYTLQLESLSPAT